MKFAAILHNLLSTAYSRALRIARPYRGGRFSVVEQRVIIFDYSDLP
ncbi:hypothetical protein [Methylomonas sp.]|nr:hypothetical protein [Methylomonas sp.]